MHLSYASTAYGVQGATVNASHTVLSDALDAAGMYVGMTRGRNANRLHVAAANLDDARDQFIAALERDRADRGLTAATQAAREAVAGLAAEGPVKLVTAERARLARRIEHADRQAEKWERAVPALVRQHDATEDMVRRRWRRVPTGTTGVQQLAEAERIAVDQVKAAAEARAARLARFSSPSTDRRRSGPEHDFGPSL